MNYGFIFLLLFNICIFYQTGNTKIRTRQTNIKIIIYYIMNNDILYIHLSVFVIGLILNIIDNTYYM